MRKSDPIYALFPAVRGALLAALLLQPERWWFMTELARHLSVKPSSLQRELSSLVEAQIVVRRVDGRRVYFKANDDAPVFPELRRLMEKTRGLIPALQGVLKPFHAQIDLALLYGSIARGEESAASDVDLMIVGSLRQIDLVPALAEFEERLRREVNVTLFSRQEFDRKMAAGDHFLGTVLRDTTIALKGTLDELGTTAAS